MGPGEVGYIQTGIKLVEECNVGDTITDEKHQTAEPLAGFKPVQRDTLYRTMFLN